MVDAVEGWAIVYGGEIDMRTINPTRRETIVSFLITRAVLTILGTVTDEDVELIWKGKSMEFDAEAIEVRIEPKKK